MENKKYQKLFARLSKNLEIFIDEVKRKNLNSVATDQWTVKEVLCHLVFWHENYAGNYQALVQHKEPPLFDETFYNLNIEGVYSLHKYPVQELISRLLKANQTLYDCIVVKKVPQMLYKKNGSLYQTSEFLDLIAGHLATHTKQVRRAK